MAIDKLTPRYLNFEDDERLVKRIEMTDAVNIRIDSDDDGDAGVIKNVVGNTQVSLLGDTLPAGNNKVIGSVHNNVKGEILFFVHNSGNNHRIYKYDDNLEKVITVYKNEATGTVASASADTLGFKATDYVDAAVLVDKDGDTLLYFTNGRGEPKKINVDKAIRGDYPDGYEGVEAYISLIKKPPLEPPTFVFVSDPNISTNRFLGKQFQFACQYVYDDGEVSAISPISKITKSPNHQNIGLISSQELKDTDNLLQISCKRINSDIKKIRFLAREGNSGVFFIIEDVQTSFSSTGTDEITINFSNEKAYTPISNNENNKQFDSVGEEVRSIAISGNRMFLGNYTEGFDLDKNSSITLHPNYHSLTDIIEVNQQGDADAGASSFTNGMYTGHTTQQGTNHSYTFGGKVSHFTPLNFTNTFNAATDYNRYSSFEIVASFSNINAQYFGNRNLNSSGSENTGNDGILSKLSPIRIQARVPLSGNYNSHTEALDDIVSHIDGLDTFEVGVSPATNAVDDGGKYTGTMRVKLEARRNFISSVGSILGGQDIITLFLRPVQVNISSTLKDPQSFFTFDESFTGLSLSTAFSQIPTIDESGAGKPKAFSNSCVFFGVDFKCTAFFNESDVATSFKAGANHSFGIVYQDKNGRLSTVKPIGEQNVEWFDSGFRNGNSGRTSMVVRIPTTELAPENAERWFPVYAGNTDVGNFIQYTVNDAFAPVNASSNKIPTGTDITDKLFVSARGFQGKENSYIDTFNPKISYTYSSGDIMKVVSVDKIRSTDREFDVLSYRDVGETDSPIATSSASTEVFEKTGNFFVVRTKQGEPEFKSGSGNRFRDKCLVEVRTPKFSSDDKVYYQIGESYDIENRVHKGHTRTSTLSLNGGFPTITGSGGSYQINTSTRVYVGDVLTVSLLSPANLTVTNVTSIGGVFRVKGTSLSENTVGGTASISVDSFSSENVIELDSGDVYFRKRLLNYGFLDGGVNTSFSYVDYIEDYRFSDFISNVSNDFGKPNAFSEEASRIHRNSSITYSDAYVMDSDRLSLSSFNNSLANFLDIKNKYGAIQRMVDIEDAFYAVQEHKVTLFPVNRNVLQSAAGDATVTLSTDVVNLNSSKSFAGDYGCGNDPEAVVYYEGVLYFVDRKANKVFSISSSGIREISDIFADSYIADKLEKADKGGEYNIYSGIDPNNDEYLLSTRTIVNKTIDVDQGNLYVLPANSGVGQADFTPHSVNSTTFGNFNLLNFNFEDVDVNFEDMGNGVLYVDDGFSDNAMQLDTPVDNLTSGSSNIVYTDKDNTFLGIAQVDNTNKFVTIV